LSFGKNAPIILKMEDEELKNLSEQLREKFLGTAENRKMIPRLFRPQPSHCTDYVTPFHSMELLIA
jgi:hypothetical protein